MSKKIEKRKFLTKEECNEIIEMCEDIGFTLKDPIGGIPVYSVNFKETDDFYVKMKKRLPFFYDFFGDNSNHKNAEVTRISVNKYSHKTTSHMEVHNDIIHFSISTSLNDDYEGGGIYFPFFNKLYNSETQKQGESVMWKGDSLLSFHEILPTISGSRYSLLLFFNPVGTKVGVEAQRGVGKTIFTQLFGLLVVKVLPIYKIIKYFKLGKG